MSGGDLAIELYTGAVGPATATETAPPGMNTTAPL
jgi:hypothetical protein